MISRLLGNRNIFFAMRYPYSSAGILGPFQGGIRLSENEFNKSARVDSEIADPFEPYSAYAQRAMFSGVETIPQHA